MFFKINWQNNKSPNLTAKNLNRMQEITEEIENEAVYQKQTGETPLIIRKNIDPNFAEIGEIFYLDGSPILLDTAVGKTFLAFVEDPNGRLCYKTNNVEFRFKTVTKEEAIYLLNSGTDDGGEDSGGSGGGSGSGGEDEPTVTTYTITYVTNGGTEIDQQTVAAGSIITDAPSTTTRDGYEFVGWYLTEDFSDAVEFPYKVMGNSTFYAKWEQVENAVITYVTNCDIVLETVSVPIGTMIDLETIIRTGYTFDGWYMDEEFTEKVEDPITLTENITVYAKWEQNIIYTVYFEENGGIELEDMNVEEGTVITLPTPIRAEYSFLGWYYDASFTNLVTTTTLTVNSDITLYAKWESALASGSLSQLNIRYIRDWCGEIYNEGSIKSASWCGIEAYDSNGENVALNKPTIYYNYAGSGSYSVSQVTDGNKGTEHFPNARGLNYVEIDLQEEYNIDKISVLHYPNRQYYNTRLQVSEDGESWYTVHDWWINGPYNEGSSGVTYDLTTIPSMVKIRYETNGGTAVSEHLIPRGQSFIPPETIKENFKFTGWFKDRELTDLYKYPSEGFLEDTTLYAQFIYDRPGLLNRQGIRYIKSALNNNGKWNSVKAFVGNVDVAYGKKNILLRGSTYDPHNCIDNLTKGREGERYDNSYLYYPDWNKSNTDVIIDLEQLYEIDHVMVCPLPDIQYNGENVYFAVSSDGVTWYNVHHAYIHGLIKTSWKGEVYSLGNSYIIGAQQVDLNTVSVRYIRERIGRTNNENVKIADIQAYVGDVNVALGKDVYENKGSYKELRTDWSSLVDGNQATGTATIVKSHTTNVNTYVDVIVDLGQEYALDRVYIKNDNNWSMGTIIEVSQDGEKWYELHNVNRAQSATNETSNNGLSYTQVYVD